jgi:hypothetical protein
MDLFVSGEKRVGTTRRWPGCLTPLHVDGFLSCCLMSLLSMTSLLPSFFFFFPFFFFQFWISILEHLNPTLSADGQDQRAGLGDC